MEGLHEGWWGNNACGSNSVVYGRHVLKFEGAVIFLGPHACFFSISLTLDVSSS